MDILTDERSRKTLARLACSAHRFRAKSSNILRRPESDPLRLATPLPANLGFDLDSYFVDSEPYRRAWMLAKSKSSSNHVTPPNYRGHEPTYLARATSSFQAAPQYSDQLSFHRSEVLEVSKMQGLWWQARKGTGEIGRVPSHYLTLLDPRISMHDNGPVRLIKRLPRANCPPPPYTQTPNKVQWNIANHTAELQVPDIFSLLDHPQIAQAVLNATD